MKNTWFRWIFLFIVAMAWMPLVFSAQSVDPGAKTKRVKASTTQVSTDDASIAASLKEKYANAPSMKDTPVGVNVRDGVVTLSGKARTGRQKGTATRMAKAVPGVKAVENTMEVEGGGKKKK